MKQYWAYRMFQFSLEPFFETFPYPPTRLHDVVSHKITAEFFTALGTSNSVMTSRLLFHSIIGLQAYAFTLCTARYLGNCLSGY
jgi:hypothetical protein